MEAVPVPAEVRKCLGDQIAILVRRDRQMKQKRKRRAAEKAVKEEKRVKTEEPACKEEPELVVYPSTFKQRWKRCWEEHRFLALTMWDLGVPCLWRATVDLLDDLEATKQDKEERIEEWRETWRPMLLGMKHNPWYEPQCATVRKSMERRIFCSAASSIWTSCSRLPRRRLGMALRTMRFLWTKRRRMLRWLE